MNSKYLLDEQPLIVLPELAYMIGLNEAIMLQQLHYWLLRSNNEVDGKKWVYNTITQWREQFPFWSENTIRRTLDHLIEMGWVVKSKLNNNPLNRTNYYTVDYSTLELFSTNAFAQNEQMGEGSNDLPKMSKCIYTENTYTETTGKVTEKKPNKEKKVWEHYSYLLNVPQEDLIEFSGKFNASMKQIKDLAEDRYYWVESKGLQREFKNWKSFLRNTSKKAFGVRNDGIVIINAKGGRKL